MTLAAVLALGSLAGCASSKTTSWKVTCPWAASGVASMVSQKVAAKSIEYSKDVTLVAEAVQGDSVTINTWVMDNKANSPELAFVNEGLLSITPIIDPAKVQFDYDDFAYVENLYSAVFVLSADASMNIQSIEDLQAFVAEGKEISVAVNGAVGSEAFLAAALFGSMGAEDHLKLVAYSSAAEAAQAVAKGETEFAVSHQSQILETYQQGGVTIVAAFDEKPIEEGAFAGVEGVGEYGYPYFKNRCFVMAPAGTDQEKITQLKELYDSVLSDQETSEWMTDTMLVEVDPLSEDEVKEHLENVRNIVEEYKDIVVN